MNSYANDRADERISDVDPGELHELKSREALRRFKRQNHFRKGFGRLVQVIISILVVASFGAVCFTKVFVIRNVEVVGTDRYTSSDILTLLAACEGDSLYSVRSTEVESLTSRLSLVRSIKVSRKLPDTLIFTITEDEAVYYCELFGEYFLLSSTLRVLDRVFDESSLPEEGLLRLELPTVDRAIVGSQLVFESDSDMKYVSAYLETLSSSSVYERVNAFDLRDKFDLELICDSKYLVQLSNGDDMATKLSTLYQVLSHDAMQDKGKARIDVTDPAEARVISDIVGEVEFSR